MNRLRRDDRGQITTALVIIGTVMVVALGMAAAKLGQATDQKSQIQTVADAAALAGAQQIAKDAPELALKALLRNKTDSGQEDRFDCRIGQDSASDFAGRAGAQLVDYCYDLDSDTVAVTVSSSTNSVSGSPATAAAEARVGVSLGECLTRPGPAPAPSATSSASPSPSPSAVATGSPLPDGRFDVDCGNVPFPIEVVGGSAKILLSDVEIRDLFDPALKS